MVIANCTEYRTEYTMQPIILKGHGTKVSITEEMKGSNLLSNKTLYITRIASRAWRKR